MISDILKRSSVRTAIALYLIFWAITAVAGNARIDQAFDEQFRYASEINSDERLEVTRINKLHVRDLLDPRNRSLIPAGGFFRYRSPGITIAPFVVVDEIGTVFASLGGLGGVRVSLWFFGEPKTWIVYSYWNA